MSHLPSMSNQRHDSPTPGNKEGSRSETDAGAYIGRLPERATETIPGGVDRKDVRVAAVAAQPAPVRGKPPGSDAGERPEGHREGEDATDDRVRAAGHNR